MSPRPAIFVSAVSKELRSARQLVSNTLTFLGYEPEWQDVFSTEEGDLRAMLRRRIEGCKAVVQLVGHSYGAEPPAPDEQFGRVSYAQYEALYARQAKKKVWYLILNEDFTTDLHDPEPQELHDLQKTYRGRLKSENLVRHSLGNRDALEANVLKLRDELSRLRRGAKRWATAVGVLLLLSVGIGLWLLQRQQSTTRQLALQGQQLTDIRNFLQETIQRPEVQSSNIGLRQNWLSQFGIDASVLKEDLALAEKLRNKPNPSTYERANAAYAAKDYDEAEKLALMAADDAKKTEGTPEAINALELAGNAAAARIQYARALEHFRAAAGLTDRKRDPLEWAREQWRIAYVLSALGNYAEAEATYRNALSEYQGKRSEEDHDVLAIRNDLANALGDLGKYAEAEMQHREVLKIRSKVLRREHPETLNSRNGLAVALYNQGKYAEAETQHEEVLVLRDRVLGPQHPDTLKSRNNLASALAAQGKYLEAERQYRRILILREEVLGSKHPDTLSSRNNLAYSLDREGKHGEAETQYRAVLKLREEVLGPEHPDTLASRSNLASALFGQGKYSEAEMQLRQVISLEEKVLGPAHPDTLAAQINLANVLFDQGEYAQAETQLRRIISLAERVLGPMHPAMFAIWNNLANALYAQGKFEKAEPLYRQVIERGESELGTQHPETLKSSFNLALCLKAEGKMDEAKKIAGPLAERAAKVIGADHPDTLKYQKLWQDLQKK